jgi:hypothetical protein
MTEAEGVALRFALNLVCSLQGLMNILPQPSFAPLAEVVIECLPAREFVRQQTPGTASAKKIEDGR